jgi:hypothetical protein
MKMMKSKRVGWAVRVARMGKIRNSYIYFVENLEGREHSEGLETDGMMILKWTL